MQTGDCLTLQVGTVRIRGDTGCFAAILGDGSVVTWGFADFGGDSSSVQDRSLGTCNRSKPPMKLLPPFRETGLL